MSAARSATVISTASSRQQTAVSSAVCRLAPTTSSPQLGGRHRRPVQLARQQQHRRDLSRRLRLRNNQRGLGSVTGRLGYSWGPALLYAKGGYAYPTITKPCAFAGAPVAFTLDGNHKNGYTVGAGLEYMFAPNWSAKVEYQYYNFGSSRFPRPGPAGAVRHLQQRRAHREGRPELSLQLGWLGARQVLIHV